MSTGREDHPMVGYGPMPPAPPPPTMPAPARPGWGRFWLGVLAGGCLVLALEVIALLVLGLLAGAAINSALHGSGGGVPGIPGVTLPSGLGSLPSGLPQLGTAGDACSPQPCVAHSGVTVVVTNLHRDAGPGSESGTHVVRMDIAFSSTASSSTHTVAPEEVALRDASGNLVLPGADGPDCGQPAGAQQLAAGQRLGPYTACYAVGGAANAQLSLVWIDAEDLAIVERRLP